MLTFAHIPTGATANTGFNIDEVNSRFVKPTGALAAIGADHRNRQGYTLRRGSGCLTFGVHFTPPARVRGWEKIANRAGI